MTCTAHIESLPGTMVFVEPDGLIFHADPDCREAAFNLRHKADGGKWPCGHCINVDVIPEGSHATRLSDSVPSGNGGSGTGTGGGRKASGASEKQLTFIASLQAQVTEVVFEECLIKATGVKIDKGLTGSQASDLIEALLKAAPAPAPSEKQVAFLKSLWEQKRPTKNDTFEDFVADPRTVEFFADPNTKKGCSKLIEMFKGLPNQAPLPNQKAAAKPAEVEVGKFYFDGEDIFEIKQAKSGNLYAIRVFDKEYVGQGWKGKSWTVLTQEQAAEFGHRTERCVICSKKLTNPASIEIGIGPICLARIEGW